MKTIGLAWRFAFLFRWRAALMIAAVFFAFLLFAVLASVDRALSEGADASAGQRLISSNKQHYTRPLPIAYVDELRRLPGVGRVSHAAWFGAHFREPNNEVSAYAVDAASYLAIYKDADVRPEDAQRFLGQRDALLVGAAVARRFGWKKGDRVPLSSSIFRNARGAVWDFEVVGVFNGLSSRVDTGYVMLNYAYLDESRTSGKGLISWMVVEPEPGQSPQLLGRVIDSAFAARRPAISTDTEQSLNQAFGAQFGYVSQLFRTVATLVFGCVVLVVASNFMVTLGQRRVELAVLKAIGFTNGRLAGVQFAEVAIVFALGAAPGMAIAVPIVHWLSTPLASSLPGLAVTMPVFASGMVIAGAMSLLLGVLPAVVAWRATTIASAVRS